MTTGSRPGSRPLTREDVFDAVVGAPLITDDMDQIADHIYAALAANPAPAGPVDELTRARDVVRAIAVQDDLDANPAPAGPLDCPCSGCFPTKLDVEQIADLFMDLRLDGPAQKGWTYQQTASWYANIIAARLERKG